ncbi:MAG: MvaI/BcnI restriction endonuclease family protein, partial [Actinomycetes bacterium]|nr:MvaI/BcnI restriction endonuclease family protein [Actinomycetes bacterium]
LYNQIIHTKKPNTFLLGTLLEESIITMDFTLSQLTNRVRDHGYLFKIKPENFPILFPNPRNYPLCEYTDIPF